MKSLSLVDFKTTYTVKKLRFILSSGKVLNQLPGFSDEAFLCFFSLKSH